MYPTGNFERFKCDILEHYSDYDEITFGILIADPRQTECREYILNYLTVFNKESGKLFDFFIPGYDKVKYNKESIKSPFFEFKPNGRIYIHQDNISFQFDEEMFNHFRDMLKQTFDIPNTFNPTLILMSMKPGYMETVKYITIELDDNEHHSARRAGQFFIDLFDAVKSDNSLEHIQYHMGKTYVKGNLLDSIINSIGKNWLTEIYNTSKNMKKYRIKN